MKTTFMIGGNNILGLLLWWNKADMTQFAVTEDACELKGWT